MSERIGHKNGFTLIEVLASMIILSIGVLGLAPLIISAIQGNSFGNDMTNATFLAQDKIEELRNVNYDLMTSGQDTVGAIQRQWAVQRNTPSTGVSKITVQASWSDVRGSNHQVTLITLRAK